MINILKEINAYNEIYVELDIPVTDYGPIYKLIIRNLDIVSKQKLLQKIEELTLYI